MRARFKGQAAKFKGQSGTWGYGGAGFASGGLGVRGSPHWPKKECIQNEVRLVCLTKTKLGSNSMKKPDALCAALMGVMVLAATIQSHAQSLIFGLTTTNSLVAFSSSGPVAAGPVLTGLGLGETAVGIDFRPFTGELYALTSDGLNVGRLYKVNRAHGRADQH
jgi:hypothetical protein